MTWGEANITWVAAEFPWSITNLTTWERAANTMWLEALFPWVVVAQPSGDKAPAPFIHRQIQPGNRR